MFFFFWYNKQRLSFNLHWNIRSSYSLLSCQWICLPVIEIHWNLATVPLRLPLGPSVFWLVDTIHGELSPTVACMLTHIRTYTNAHFISITSIYYYHLRKKSSFRHNWPSRRWPHSLGYACQCFVRSRREHINFWNWKLAQSEILNSIYFYTQKCIFISFVCQKAIVSKEKFPIQNRSVNLFQ